MVADSKVSIQLRISESTHKKVKTIAEKELRSINSQLEYFIVKGIEAYHKGNVTSEH